MGMVSVFDIEEVGASVLAEELGIDASLAQRMVETAAAKAKEVAAQQQKEKEEREARLKAEQAQLAAALSGEAAPVTEAGEHAASAILGAASAPSPGPSAEDERRAADILGGPQG
jgi:regulator of protease activity HflC (stomatin/prohibitin superfamily)